MIILSHRGCWKNDFEKNSLLAFELSFKSGFGTELDVRDYCGKLVVSHDIPSSDSIEFVKFLDIYSQYGEKLLLAINIKSCGLQELLVEQLKQYHITNYFVFDMSVPDAIVYLQFQMKIFTRESEFEESPSFYNEADGVWMDEFNSSWITPTKIINHLKQNKKVCIVSPELHKKEHLSRWKIYKDIPKNILNEGNLMLCTDYPEQAREYFYD